MANEKLISDIVRFMKTHCEYFCKEERERSIPMDNGFFMTIELAHQDGLQKGSHEYRENMIAIWTEEAIRRFGNAN